MDDSDAAARGARSSGRSRGPVGLAGSVGLALIAALVSLSAACAPSEPVDLIVDNVTIVDVVAGELLADRAVIVREGKISEITTRPVPEGYAAARTIEAAGGYLIPALADAHVHLQYPSELESYLQYGVGVVVDMAGSPRHLELREELDTGLRAGPRLVAFGPTLDGTEPTNPLFTSVTPETAERIVEWIVEEGYDAIKVYQSLDAATLGAIVEAGRSNATITSGHVPRATGVEGAFEAGLRYVAHGEELAFEAFDESSRRFDRRRIDEIADLVIGAGVTVTPMIAYLEDVPTQVLALDDFLAEESLSRMPAGMKLSFGARQGWFSQRDEPEEFAAQMRDAAEFVAELTVAIHERGGALVLGTDAGFGGAVPGYGVHRELRALVAAGLTEVEALRTATAHVGDYLREIDPDRIRWGRIEPGFAADFVLLRENPLDSISATEAIEGVASRGRWYSRADLDEIDTRLRERQQAHLPYAIRFEEALVAGDVPGARAAWDEARPHLDGDALIAASNCIFLGYRHYYGGRREVARELYEICAEMHPRSAPLWWHIGQAREASDRAGAREAYARAREANPWYRDPAEQIRRLEVQEAPSLPERVRAESE